MSIHGIDEAAVRGAPTFEQLAAELREVLSGSTVVCHTHFDRGAITRSFEKAGQVPPDCVWLDSARIARRTWPDVARSGYGLQNLCDRLGYTYDAHDALEDAKAAAVVFLEALAESKMGLVAWQEQLAQPYREKVSAAGNPDGPLHGVIGNQDARLPDWGAKSNKQLKAEALIAKGQHIHILSEVDFERLVQQYGPTPGEPAP